MDLLLFFAFVVKIEPSLENWLYQGAVGDPFYTSSTSRVRGADFIEIIPFPLGVFETFMLPSANNHPSNGFQYYDEAR